MKSNLIGLSGFVFLTLLSGGLTVWAQGLPEIISAIKPSIVGVGTYQRIRSPPAQFRGTGFAIADGRYVLTNAHVLPGTNDTGKRDRLVVFVNEGKKSTVRSANKIAADYKHDVALLKISGEAIPAMKLGDSQTVREGELYAFTGYPIGMILGLHPVTHRGIVSAISPIVIPTINSKQLNRKMLARLQDPYEVFQLDATAYPGNSGSPLYQIQSGKVIGIINKVFVKETKENILAKPSGISYAIPIKYAKALMKKHGLASVNRNRPPSRD